MIATRTRKMAREAYQRVVAHRGPGERDYKSLADALPGMILQNGLAQATGFLVAKGEREHKAIRDDLNAVLVAGGVVGTADGEELHREIVASDNPRRWMQLTRHSLAASAWIKRYAQGVLRDQAHERTDDRTEAAEGRG